MNIKPFYCAPAGVFFWVVAIGATAACREKARIEPRVIEPEIAGCFEINGDVCEARLGAEVRYWIDVAPRDVSASGTSSIAASGLGTLVMLKAASEPQSVDIFSRSGVWKVRTQTIVSLPRPAAVVRVEEALRSGNPGNTGADLGPLLTSSVSLDRAYAESALARIHVFKAEYGESAKLLRSAAERFAAAGRVGHARRDLLTLVYVLLYGGRQIQAAREALQMAKVHTNRERDFDLLEYYYNAAVVFELGDLRAALDWLQRARETAQRLHNLRIAVDSTQMIAQVLQSLGRFDDADSELRAPLDDAAIDVCTRASVLGNLGWLRIRHNEAARVGERSTDPSEPLLAAATIYRAGCTPPQLQNVLASLALAHVRRGDVIEARGYLDEARAIKEQADPLIVSTWQEIEAELATRTGDTRKALAAFERLRELSNEAVLPESKWRAEIGRATNLAKLGRVSDAKRAFLEAFRTVERAALVAPLGEGRSTFLARFQAGNQAEVKFLLERGLIDEAMFAARRARAHFLNSLAQASRASALSGSGRAEWEKALSEYHQARNAYEQTARERWKLAAADLLRWDATRESELKKAKAALDEGLSRLASAISEQKRTFKPKKPQEQELVVMVTPVETQWIAFAASVGSTVFVELGPVGEDEKLIASQLIEQLRDQLLKAGSISMILDPSLEQLDFHQVKIDEQAIAEIVPFVYRLDLDDTESKAEPSRKALIVVDPRRNLPAAVTEARNVLSALEKSALTVQTLTGTAATRAAIMEQLDDGEWSLFHFAGHASFAGTDGLASSLAVAQTEHLSSGDVLVLKHAPQLVFLSSCESGRSSGEDGEQNVGLAQAFLAAGAAVVIGTTRPVHDELALEMSRQFYAGDLGAPMLSFQRAQRELISRRPNEDWAAFRLWVR